MLLGLLRYTLTELFAQLDEDKSHEFVSALT